jgi:RNA polymerase sigma-70 factor (ECF subfamily)
MQASSEPTPEAVTELLLEWKGGSKTALDRLTPLVYRELRRLAAYYLRNEQAANTLQPTALVHEAYLRLVKQSLPDWESRAQFFGVAAHLMRQILVDRARRRASAKRGAGAHHISVEEVAGFLPARSLDIEQLDDALTALAACDSRKAGIIELRYFGGLCLEEIGQSLNISTATVFREQRIAEAWLHRELAGSKPAA